MGINPIDPLDSKSCGPAAPGTRTPGGSKQIMNKNRSKR
jgi:hypothetical protein